MTLICIKHIVPGFHAWPEAPPTVSFLQEQHRHLFTYKLWFEVTHDDRDFEFFMLKASFQGWLDRKYSGSSTLGYKFQARSCEHLAKEAAAFHPNITAVEVWEDDENGALVPREDA